MEDFMNYKLVKSAKSDFPKSMRSRTLRLCRLHIVESRQQTIYLIQPDSQLDIQKVDLFD